MSLIDMLGITTTSETRERVEMRMEITPDIYQPHGFLHGGATIALLESAASAGAALSTDFETQRPFGTLVTVRHRKPGKSGVLRAIAELASQEESYGSIKQTWSVVALDDEGDVVSEGEVITKIVTLARLAEKEAERAAQHAE